MGGFAEREEGGCHALLLPGMANTAGQSVRGRMKKALEGMPRFNRWGKHFLRSMARALQLQQCTNMKDEALSVYGCYNTMWKSAFKS